MASGNFAMRAFEHAPTFDASVSDRMTVTGTAIKTAVLGAVCAVSAVVAWGLIQGQGGGPGLALMMLIGGCLLGLVIGMMIWHAPRLAPVLAVPFAVVEGASLAGFSWIVAHRWLQGETGVIFQAVGITFAVLVAMSCLYAAGLRLGRTGLRVLAAATGGVLLYWLALMVCNMLLGMSLPNLFASASPLGIGFTVVCLLLASFWLVADFQFIEEGASSGQPKYMEWVGAYALLVTLVWIYIEVLRLLAKLRR